MKIVRLYEWGGFVVEVILMDKEFDKVVEHVPLIEMNTCTAPPRTCGQD